MSSSPRILIFTGDGKGKTTASLGMVLRNAGHGKATRFIQFVKSQLTGEHEAIKVLPNVDAEQVGLGFLPKADSENFNAHKDAAAKGLILARAAIDSDKYDMVILDEICFAVASGLLTEDQVIETVNKARPEQCIVLTGRGATEKLIAIADTVTEMKCIKHGADTGIEAQKGVEL
jgi:cob(I)alamin adenosyltransferase